jgi:predicted kinase
MKLRIIRGLPGAGKTTYAKKIALEHGILSIEADQFFIRDGRYQFDGSQVRAAHQWCQNTCKNALESGMDVIVSNTFTIHRELQPYLDFAKKFNAEIEIIHVKGEFPSLHDVPEQTLQAMRERWQSFSGEKYYYPENAH